MNTNKRYRAILRASALVSLLAASSVAVSPLATHASSSQYGGSAQQQAAIHYFLPKGRTQPTASGGNLLYNGGPIQKNPKVYITYWGWTGDPSGEAPYLQNFLNGVGGSGWLNTVTQYYDSTRANITSPTGQLKGTWSDNTNHAPPQPSQSDLAKEAVASVAHFGYDPDATYFIATATGKSAIGFATAYCAWHSSTSSTYGQVAYVNFPYMTDAGSGCGQNWVNSGSGGLLDGVSIVAGHELAEAETDPQPTSGWTDSTGNEVGDKCAWMGLGNTTLGTGTFATQPLWSNAANNGAGGCVSATAISTWGLYNGQIYGFNPSYLTNPSGAAFTQIPGSLTNIAVGGDGSVWGLYNGQIFRFNPSYLTNPSGAAFTQIPGSLTSIAVG